MADDDPPLSSTVTETVTTDTGADKEIAASLNAQFEDFWKEEDEKTDGAPAAPGDGAAQETREPKPERKDRTKAEPPPKTETTRTAPETKEYSDEEIDKLETPPHWKPEVIEQVKNLKDLWKADRARAKAESERATKAEKDLAEARQNAWTPETKADYEHAAAVRRKFDFSSDPEFVARFHTPFIEKYHDLLNEAVDVLPNRQLAIEWAKYIAENYSPDSPELSKAWWNHSVIDKIPDETDKATVRQSVANLLRMQKERDAEIHRRTNDKSAYDNWVKERDLARSQWEVKEVMDEIGIQEQKIKEVLKKDPADAKTAAEREAIEKHNEKFEVYNGHFQEVMKDLSFNGPRAKVRAAVLATKAMYVEDKFNEMEKRAKSAEAERDQLRSELDKITGVRRKISHTTGTPPASSSAGKNGGLSIKDLDVRKSFDKFDWGDGT